ncbi:hypothetical protein [Kribbella sp. CA-247076]|uniref:hypothetical protein n=1 Tax=Kribbella sp. CA-247076 TaxID=3239941 RepID=UPI003D909101
MIMSTVALVAFKISTGPTWYCAFPAPATYIAPGLDFAQVNPVAASLSDRFTAAA